MAGSTGFEPVYPVLETVMLPLHQPPMVASPVVETGALGVSDQCSTTELRIHLVNFVCLYRVYHTVEIVSTDSTENLKILGNTAF